MNKFYPLISVILFSLSITGCSKDFLKRYDKRIVGTWEVTDIDKRGIGSSPTLPFKEGGLFSFADDGTLVYSFEGTTYNGSWDIRKDFSNDENVRSLHITAVDFTNQKVLSEFFNEMIFTGTNRFNAFIHSGTRTHVYRFSRR